MGKKKIVTKTDTEATTPAEGASSGATSKKAPKKQVINGVAHIKVSYNNTTICVTDPKGNVITWSSAGLLGFKGSKKSTPYAANLVAKDCIEKAKKFNLTNVKILERGIGPARESSIRGIAGTGINIISIMDVTPVAHNGVKAKKPRRL